MTMTERWRKSSFSGNGGCVEINELPDGGAEIRDSKLGDTSPVLRFNRCEWTAHLDAVRAGEYHAEPRRTNLETWAIHTGALTPFPDGEGYLDHVWAGLSKMMRYMLGWLDGTQRLVAPPATLRALCKRGLVFDDQQGRWQRTERGQALIEWATRTGRIEGDTDAR